MKVIKKILIVLGALIALLLIIALFVKKDYTITREVVINKPRHEVFNYVKLFEKADNYNVWMRMDMNKKIELRGTDGTVGCVMAWEGDKNVGKGEQEIKRIIDGERIDLELRFIKPMEGLMQWSMTTDSLSENQTRVTSTSSATSKYPFNIMNLCMDKLMGDPMQETLNNLKQVMEGNTPVAEHK